MKTKIKYPHKAQTMLSDDMLTYLNTFSGETISAKLRNVMTSHSLQNRNIRLLEAREEALMTEAKGNYDELQEQKKINKQAIDNIAHRIEKAAELEVKLQDQQAKIKSLTETVQQCHEIDAKHVRMIGELQSTVSFVKVAMYLGWFIAVLSVILLS